MSEKWRYFLVGLSIPTVILLIFLFAVAFPEQRKIATLQRQATEAIAANDQRSNEEYQALSNTYLAAVKERDTCNARFARPTVLYDAAGAGAAQHVELLNGLVSLAPGSAIGGTQPKVAWLIPADVEPIFYGTPGEAKVAKWDPQTKQWQALYTPRGAQP
jgi:hypothetical protein